MAAKHTLGPWVAEHEAGRGAWIKGASGEWTAVSCGYTDESARANARLIVESPAMLEALRDLLAASQPQNSMRPGFVYLAEAQEAAHAILARIDGED